MRERERERRELLKEAEKRRVEETKRNRETNRRHQSIQPGMMAWECSDAVAAGGTILPRCRRTGGSNEREPGEGELS